MHIPRISFSSEFVRAGLRVAAVAFLCLVLPSQLLTAPLPEGVRIEDMTWTDVRSALQAGYTTVIVPTGGLEQNGPHMVIGKHDYIVGEAAARIAKDVGHTLVAPVVAYVPEGNYDPPTGHMRFPGTIGVPAPVFDGVLEGIARSLKAGGFKTICFIGDHGESQPVQAAVAKRLSAEWASAGVRVVQIDAYYDDTAQIKRLLAAGKAMDEIGQHASIIDTSELMSVNPKGVDLSRYRSMTFGLGASGASGDPGQANPELGASLLAMRIAAAGGQIKALRATQ
jgi:creatinine amidohydrolase/Fe(II)-dependent formamide hydrolase-like protein